MFMLLGGFMLPPGIPLMLPRFMPAGLGPDNVGEAPSPVPTMPRLLFMLCVWVLRVGLWFGGLVLEPGIESLREMVWVRGEAWGMFSAFGCSVPIEVTPESPALPALERP